MNSVKRMEDFTFQITFWVPLLPISVHGNSIAGVFPFTRKSCYFFSPFSHPLSLFPHPTPKPPISSLKNLPFFSLTYTHAILIFQCPLPRRGELYADRQPGAEKAGVLVFDELCQESTRHGHHGCQHLCEGERELGRRKGMGVHCFIFPLSRGGRLWP